MNMIDRKACDSACEKLRTLVKEERKLEQEILGLMRVIFEKQWYKAKAYSSMHDFLVEDSGMDRATAYRRVQVLGLIEKAPVVARLIETGKMSVSNAVEIHKSIQMEAKLEKEEGKNSSVVQKEMKERISTLITETLGMSFRECQRTLAVHLPLQAEQRAQKALETPLPDGRTQLVMSITPELQKKLDEIKSLLSHVDPHPTPEKLLELMADRVIQTLRKNKPAQVDQREITCSTLNKNSDLNVASSSRRTIWGKAGSSCEFRDELTGKRCGSTFQLEIEHIHPRALGGTHELKNLMLLCRSHNRYAAWRAGLLVK